MYTTCLFFTEDAGRHYDLFGCVPHIPKLGILSCCPLTFGRRFNSNFCLRLPAFSQAVAEDKFLGASLEYNLLAPRLSGEHCKRLIYMYIYIYMYPTIYR